MIIQHQNLVIELKSGVKYSYKYGESVLFQFLKEGVLFIQEQDFISDDPVKKTKTVTFKRTWIPTSDILKVDAVIKSVIDGEDVEKYNVFMKHNVDITKQQVSYTAPLTPQEIEKAIVDAQKAKEAAKNDPVQPEQVKN